LDKYVKANDGKKYNATKAGKEDDKCECDIFDFGKFRLSWCSRKSHFRTRSGIFEFVVQCSKKCTMKCFVKLGFDFE